MNNVVLVGFMGSGKSTVGPILARLQNRPFIDLDDEIVKDAGRPIAEIFAQEGEDGFRKRESRMLQRTLDQDDCVVAVGGGAPRNGVNWELIRKGNRVVALTAEPAELARRLNGSTDRPLLQPDASTAIASLLQDRIQRYFEADLVVSTDGVAPEVIARRLNDRLASSGMERVPIEVPGSPHEASVGARLRPMIVSTLIRLGISGTVVVVSDRVVAEAHGAVLMDELTSAGIDAKLHLVPVGEAAKAMDTLAEIYEALAAASVDRAGALIALGGGAVGDVAGFAAATWMRGIRYIQVPTTLLAMVDSSIGGKTAINLPSGKNLVGAVHQPSAIFCDLDNLASLPDDEYRAALAEIIKAGVIADRAFFDWLSANLAALLGREPSVLRKAVVRAIRIKARVVASDPYETGPRAILNYGHTVAHALERAMGYGQLRHGEAVAWGMAVAARLSVISMACSASAAELQDSLLRASGLLGTRPDVRVADLIDALRHDKKTREGRVYWVLLRDIGRVEYGRAVNPGAAEAALAEVMGA
ncbi:MAG: 3-dehydroquinate synthase [Chloroflexi bacterium]|nr:MAG: 3-dehydroquinate synthase [Chloroflexota bacterium]